MTAVPPPVVSSQPDPKDVANQTLNPENWWAVIKAKVHDYFFGDSKRMPSWMVSFCVHLAIILVLALIPIISEPSSVLNLFLNTGDGADGDVTAFEIDSGTTLDDASLSTEQLSLDTINVESSMPVEIPAIDLSTSISDMSAPASIRLGLTGRTGAAKEALLGAYGGTKATEDAVELGLQWLARNQSGDGSWSLKGPYRDGSDRVNRLAATSMALIAFAGAGNTPIDGKYKENVAKGVSKLIRWQEEDGSFDVRDNTPEQHKAYSHAQATIALCELYGMTGEASLRQPAQLAVNYCQEWQDPEQGGWRYVPRTDSDLSVTGWFVMALTSARMAGLSTDKAVLDRANKYLDRVSAANNSLYYYASYSVPTEDGFGDRTYVQPAMTAEGLLCRMYLGWSPTDERIRAGANRLAEIPIEIDITKRDYYYWYYCTQTMHHIGNPLWSGWNDVMKEALPALQVKTGAEAGSWPPQGDSHGSEGGRLYSTCLAIYCLEVYYRHLPLYDHRAQRTMQ